jgi:phospholipid/cholesterol/gamma-HCH transport system permease protein
MPTADAPTSPSDISRDGRDLRIRLAGDWKLQGERPAPDEIYRALEHQQGGALSFDASELGAWDSSLLVFLLGCEERCRKQKIDFRRDTLPREIGDLIALSQAVPEKQTGRDEPRKKSTFIRRLGKWGLVRWAGLVSFVQFFGESILSLIRVARGRGAFNKRDFFVTLQETSMAALPIVSLISFLTGLILAFVGSVQLQKFGASIYVANLVGLGMTREMGALMTAIIMAGRTGAAFAAQLGSMKVSEEIDALKTLGISPQDFLVTPRVLALFAMMPLLCLYADFIGMVGGALVGLGLMKLTWAQYIHQTLGAVKLLDIITGLIKSVTFGGIVAVTGCLRGMQCGDNASAVGLAATSAVVTGITLIVIADAVFDLLYNVLGI